MGEETKVAWGTPQPEIETVKLNEKTLYEELRKKARRLRLERGITQDTLAKALGVSTLAVWRMENNTMMSVAQLLKLNKIYDVPIPELLDVSTSTEAECDACE